MENFIKDYITSLKNPKIKNIIHLQKASERRSQNIFIIEGQREIEKAINSGYEFVSLYFCKKIVDYDKAYIIVNKTKLKEVYEVSSEVYEKIAYRENTEGFVILARPKTHTLNEIHVTENPLILVLEGVEKPGNIGAILRTADAAGVDAVIICDLTTDLYNPNIIRSSIGCLFTVQVAVAESKKTIEWLKGKNINIYCTYLKASVAYFTVNYKQPTAIVMGTEATGISDIWVNSATKNIIIPMYGQADSMNVSTSTAVVVFEACRQRFVSE